MSEYRPIIERLRDYRPVELRLTDSALQKELTRCQDCGIPFCHALGCPLYNLIPEINLEAKSGRWASSLGRLLVTNPFPEFTGRVCPALCEGSCVQGLHENPVPARLVELEVIERGFSLGLIKSSPRSQSLDLAVGVIGGGPAGLAVAHRLNRAGAKVTVYEKDAQIGGFLRYGIPDFKLEKEVIDRRLELMMADGVTFHRGVEAGLDISTRLLRKRHQVLVLAIGARRKRDLAIPGRDLLGVHFATDYLAAQNRVNSGEEAATPADLNAFGRKVVVIGGGDTGSDCVGTAWRQGAVEVSQYEILPKPPATRAPDNPWPQWPRTLRTSSSHEEGCLRRWGVNTLELTPDPLSPGHVGGLRAVEVEWEMEGARLIKPVPKQGSEFLKEADLVLLAMGFTGPEPGSLREAQSIKPDPLGRLGPGLYAAGDAANGPSLVVRAISDGLKVAETILADYQAQAASLQPS
ncbi:MAG: glutamate synthase subunit beta [Deltaproteobacteria bacterium]|jgi:glutamate synthase (NADPH/NADH) small chain|nr:glutamate synthase subunit beta [Deltaproteobacteria bacterium]